MLGFGRNRQFLEITRILGRRLAKLSFSFLPLFLAFFSLLALTHCTQGGLGLGGLNAINQATQLSDQSSGENDNSGGEPGGQPSYPSIPRPVPSGGGNEGSDVYNPDHPTVASTDTLTRSGPGFQPTVGGQGKNEHYYAGISGTLESPCQPLDPDCPPNSRDVTVSLKILKNDGTWFGPWNISEENYRRNSFFTSVTFDEDTLLHTGICTTTLHFEAQSADGNFAGSTEVSGCPALPDREISVNILLQRITPLPPNQELGADEFIKHPLPLYKQMDLERIHTRQNTNDYDD